MSASLPRPSSSWWLADIQPFPTATGDLDADVLIVGGGIAGVTLAHALAARESRVVLVDGGWIAGSASGRNAGFLMAGPAEPYAELIALYGRPGARAVLDIGRRNHERIRALVQDLGIECGYAANGSVRLARTEEEAEDQRASVPLLREEGFRVAEVPVPNVVPAESARHFRAAFFDPDDGELDPVAFVRGLARHAESRGARLCEHTALRSARWHAGAWQADCDSARVRAGSLVLATNAFTPQLCPVLEPLIRPRRGQMLVTAPLTRRIARLPTYAHWGYQYWRQLADGRLLLGGWRDLDLDGEVGYEDRPTQGIQRGIEGGLRQLVPEGAAIEGRWAGTMGFARDGRPLVGWLDAEHHLAICAGFTGHGMGMAAGCTEGLAELLSFLDAPGIQTFAPVRFPELAHAGSALLTVGAGGAQA